ncbi:SDR family oxidoreductase [Maricurvus nonylphenolicus]|uniref:SDR family NAD(P)-dependent oxidoreductase n=1 Tax=Maricurvus nonylphenolicus TaxID=1008307 RepID=UPI0036F39779
MDASIANLLSMEGKVALVTGASSGLGAHFAKTLAAAGAHVVAAARRKERLDNLVTDIIAAGGKASAVAMDVTCADSVESALQQATKIAGPIDVLINNAGVADPRHSLKVKEENWDFVMDANLKGAWRVAQTVASMAVTNERNCSIVNIASILGLRVGFGESTYATAKAGLIQLTKAMALELARKGVRVNAICPGYFETEMNSEYLHSEAGKSFMGNTPSGRHGQLQELTAPLLLLASDSGSYINGVALAVDGGHIVNSL